MEQSSNPALKLKSFEKLANAEGSTMTVNGTVNKTLVLLALVLAGATWSWSHVFGYWSVDYSAVKSIATWAGVGAMILAFVTIFKKSWSPVTAPAYALVEGAALGAISSLMEGMFPGIVIHAVFLTFGVAVIMFSAYRLRLIQATEKFKLGVVAATGAICLVYVIDIVMSMFGTQIPMIHESGWMGIGFSLFVVGIAALNLILDFDFVEASAEMRLPKYMEWYGGFSLMLTLVWLYLEILHLLAKSRD